MAEPATEAAGTPGAATLVREYLACLARRDVDGMIALMAPDGISDFPYAPDGIATTYVGDDVRPLFEMVIARLLTSVSVEDVEVTEVGPELAFVEFRSDCATRGGGTYRNRYIARVAASEGRITLWREYYDPRATASVR